MSTSVTRALRVLAFLADSDKPQALVHISEHLGAPKSTVHGILRDLLAEQFIEAVDPGGYVIGLRAFEVGAARLRQVSAVAIVSPELARLTRELNVTSHYAVLDQADVVYLCKEDPPSLGIQLASSVGARLTSHWTAVGKACLAWLDDDRVQDHIDLRRTNARARTHQMPALLAELARVHSQGYATDDGETAAGIQCVAAPVFDHEACCGAIGVSYPRDMGPAPEDIAVEVRAAARQATGRLGGWTPT